MIVYFSGASSSRGPGLPETSLDSPDINLMLTFIDATKDYKPNSRFRAVIEARLRRKEAFKSSCGSCKLARKCPEAWDDYNLNTVKRVDCLATK